MLLLIDESAIAEAPGRCCYIVAAGLVLPDNVDEIREAANEAIGLGRNSRRRPFHWTDEGVVARTRMLEVVASLSEEVILSVASEVPLKHQENARQSLLRAILTAAGRDHDISAVMFESREKSGRNEGQNRHDYTTLIEARHARELAVTATYTWAGKAEPLLWLPDAVAGGASAEHLGDPAPLLGLHATGKLKVLPEG